MQRISRLEQGARGLLGCLWGGCLAAPMVAMGADVPYAVGTSVVGELGGGPGTIAEIGTQPPHVGAYRITFSWSPRGEWYFPNTWVLHPVGSNDRCVTAPAAPAPSAVNEPAAGSGSAQASGAVSSERCPAGDAVIDRQQRPGQVLGESNGMCQVRLADGEVRSYLHWMLSSPGATAEALALAPGNYTCSADGAGYFRIEIRGDGSYVNQSGTSGGYALDTATAQITFSSGSLAGYHSKLLGPGKFGLSQGSATRFYTVCNLKH